MQPQARKYSSVIEVSEELLDEARRMQPAFERWMAATPEERERWEREAHERRRIEREQAGPPVALTLERLLDKLGFSREYAEHLMQPYCACYDGRDGWEYCQHARDLGLTGT